MSTIPARRFLQRSSPPSLFTLVVLAGVSAMTMGIYLPSLPAMEAYFATEYWIVQLSVALYLGVNGALQIVIGPISDRFGRRPILLWSCALFCLATLGCIYAPTIEIFLAFRMAQAVIVAAMVLSRAIVRDMVGPAEAASMIGYVTMGMALVPMAAPALGGALEAQFGWQGSFWALLVAGLGLWALTWADAGETHWNRSTSFTEQFHEYPELVQSRRFWGYAATAAFASGAFFAYLGGAPYVGADIFGMGALELGIYLGAPAIGYMVGNGISGRFSVQYGINRMMLWGALIAASGLFGMTAGFAVGFATPAVFFGFMIFVGIGNGLVLPNATAGLLSIHPHLAGTASGLGGALMIGGGAALSAVATVVTGDGQGALPLILLMFASSILGVVTAAYTIARARKVGAEG